MTIKIDATRPLYAVVGAGDLAVEYARSRRADVQAKVADVQKRVSKIDLEPTALRDQARTVVVARIDELNEDAREARSTVEIRAKQTRKQVEEAVNEALVDVTETYDELADRGRKLVQRIRRQQATQDAKAAANTTVAKAKTARTQTSKSAKSTGSTAKKATKSTSQSARSAAKSTGQSARNSARSTSESAKKTGATAKRNAKSTTTSARKTASATSRATSDAASKVGN